MIHPYAGNPGNSGMLLLDEEEIFEMGRIAAPAGLSLATHAIGDRANHVVLNAYAQVREFEKENLLVPLRHRIEHVQVLHPSDLGRLAELGVIASMQPVHATSDMIAADTHWGRRAKYAYAWHTLLEQKTAIAFGSDAPVESPNPFWGLYAAVSRRRRDGTPSEDGWYPDQRLDLVQALHSYTLGAAFAGGAEHRQGRLAPGTFADLIVLPVDPYEEPHALADLLPRATMVAGQWVWEKP
jgi:predicted amidohydrolase YtcJ